MYVCPLGLFVGLCVLLFRPCQKQVVTTSRIVNVTTVSNTTFTEFNPADVVFALDESSSVGEDEWSQVGEYINICVSLSRHVVWRIH